MAVRGVADVPSSPAWPHRTLRGAFLRQRPAGAASSPRPCDKRQVADAPRENIVVRDANFGDVADIFERVMEGARTRVFSWTLIQPQRLGTVLLLLLIAVLFRRLWLGGHRGCRSSTRVVEQEGRFAGFALLAFHPDLVEIELCSILPAYRRCRLGRALVEDAIRQAGALPLRALCMPSAHGMGMLLRDAGFADRGNLHLPNAQVTLRRWYKEITSLN